MTYNKKFVIDIRKIVERRRRVAELCAQGLDNVQIAAALGIPRTTAYQDRKANALNAPPDISNLLTVDELHERAGVKITAHYFSRLLLRYGIKPACNYANIHWYDAASAERCIAAIAATKAKKRELAKLAAAAHNEQYTTKGKPRYLTEDEKSKLDYLCRCVADGKLAVDVALTMGISERQLRGLYNRAKNYGYDYQGRVASAYVDKCEQARKQHLPVPTPPAPAYSIAIRLEANRRGVPREAVAVYEFTGWDSRVAERNKAYWKQHLHAEEMARYNELAELKVKLYNEGGETWN